MSIFILAIIDKHLENIGSRQEVPNHYFYASGLIDCLLLTLTVSFFIGL
jgi:hypothetical protein